MYYKEHCNISHFVRLTRAYVKGRAPHPATEVKILGPRSLAGLMAYPQLRPKLRPIANTTRPTAAGIWPWTNCMFLLSVMAHTAINNIAVPITCIKELT